MGKLTLECAVEKAQLGTKITKDSKYSIVI